jgi:hypothetical protein
MKMKVVNIDEFLQDKAIKIVLKGKEFVVHDVSDEVRKLMDAEQPDYKAIVKAMLGCTDADLEGYGIVAFTNIIAEVTKNLFPDASLKEVSTD